MIIRSNNFEKQSAGAINTFINDPCTWILDHYTEVPPYEQRNPYLWRGNVLEAAVQDALIAKRQGRIPNPTELGLECNRKWNELKNTNLEFLRSRQDLMLLWREQWTLIKSCCNHIPDLVEMLGVPTEYQKGLRKYFPELGLNFRVTGVADFVFKHDNYVIEMKTKKSIDYEHDHGRQGNIYGDILVLKPRILYLTPEGYKIFDASAKAIK
jgi:hypothetical protein